MWDHQSIKQRCRIVASAAATLCDRSQELIQACQSDQRIDPVETITGELMPLCAALDWIGRSGAKVLVPRRVGLTRRPLWMWGVQSCVYRVPLGQVLILGTWNYPLLLPGVQIAQALAAGNSVQLKPALGTEAVSEILVECLHRAGVPRDQLTLLDSSTSAAVDAMAQGVDLIVLTGSAQTGRKVLQAAAPKLSASIMELSGCDAVVALDGADRQRLVDAIAFGLKFNGSATCIGPRRLMLEESVRGPVLETLDHRIGEMESAIVHPAARQSVADSIRRALDAGAVDRLGRYCDAALREDGRLYPLLLDHVTEKHEIAAEDVFAPVLSVMTVDDTDHAVRLINECPYRLAASIFGPIREARRVAALLQVGTVTINDLIAPTADPRLPFGGRGQSGFGVTRGPEGLLAMTAPKVISNRRGRFAPHLRRRSDFDAEMLHGVLHLLHGAGIRKKLAGLRRLVGSVKKR